MNNPNEIYKMNNSADPLDECPTLQEYILDLIALASSADTSFYNDENYAAHLKIEKLIDILKEMAVGNWKIRIDEEGD